jgi:iron complex transport system substrate-binding protein
MKQYRAVVLASLLVASIVGVAATPAAASHERADCSFPVTATDDTGTNVTLSEPAETVVATDAASAQTLWEIGANETVVGMPVRPYTEYLNGSENRTDVLTDDGTGFDVETIIELDADLVVAPNYMSDDTVAQLRAAGQTVYRSPFEESFEDIYAKTELYGHFVGECEASVETANQTRREVETVREAVADRERPDVLYYFFGTAAGNGTFIGDMVETAGGTNVAAEAGIEGYGEPSDEVILERDPGWIVTTDDPNAFDPEEEPFPSTTAVRNDRLLVVDANLVSQAGPRVVEPLRTMAEAFHPEAFREQTPTEAPTASPTDGGAESDGADEALLESGSEADGAGLDVLAAASALGAAASLLGRR